MLTLKEIYAAIHEAKNGDNTTHIVERHNGVLEVWVNSASAKSLESGGTHVVTTILSKGLDPWKAYRYAYNSLENLRPNELHKLPSPPEYKTEYVIKNIKTKTIVERFSKFEDAEKFLKNNYSSNKEYRIQSLESSLC